MGNMYGDSIYQWNVFKGCKFDCIYCKPSFQRQAKRQRWNCKILNENGDSKCYTYEPHFHEERLKINFNLDKYETKGDQFIWACSSGDIYWMKFEWLKQVINKIKQYPNRTFFMQTKNPIIFTLIKDQIPSNLKLGITLETNLVKDYKNISLAPNPIERFNVIKAWNLKINFITIEPILDFTMEPFIQLIRCINPERIYIGYNSKPKQVQLPEPSLQKTKCLIKFLTQFTKVKTKLLRESNGI